LQISAAHFQPCPLVFFVQLTLLNSVVAVTLLAKDLFPAKPLSMPSVAASVGVMNLIGPWFGCMPSCHGAGGLAAQARFGATTGAAPMLLGVVKIIIGLFFGSSLFDVLKAFPDPLLGVLLLVSGAELASSASKLNGSKREWCDSWRVCFSGLNGSKGYLSLQRPPHGGAYITSM
jgi:hypothetical protein